MSPIRLFTDEDVFGAVAARLRQKGFDAVSTPEADRLGESDVSQLVWTTRNNRVLLAFNVADFALIHDEWSAFSRHHAGIMVSGRTSSAGSWRWPRF